jgi:uncharacterized surface protein with fasciclin (FAS1) repeats
MKVAVHKFGIQLPINLEESMTIGKKLWQMMAFVMVMALLVGGMPAATMSAQSNAIVSSTVRGELSEQFAKHYLELRVTDPSRSVRLVMDYNPQDRQELERSASFYVFDEAGFNELVRNGNTKANLATGALETSTGVKQKVAIIADPVGTFTVVPFNDSNVPFDYTLTVENAVLVDSSGEQVTDPNAPAGDATAATATAAEESTSEATATPAATPEATAAVTATVTVTATETPATAIATIPTEFSADELEGELNERFAKHYFELDTEDITRAVVVELTYDPQDSQALDNGLNFYIFDEAQFRRLNTAPSRAENTAAGELVSRSPKTKRATVSNPFRTYTIVVSNDSDVPANYTLTVENAILTDGSAQSITAQELGVTGTVTATTTTTGTVATTTGTAATTATTPAAPVANALTPPTTYTVQSGDTIGTISRRAYGTSQLFQQICNYNNIADCNRIEVGDEIELPVQSELGSAAPAAATTPAAATATPAAATTPAATTATPAATAEPVEETGGSSVNAEATGDLIATAGTFSVLDTLGLLLDLLELEADQTNNIKAILQTGEYTFFAPTDTAFTSLDEATLEELIANPTQLANVLKGHIVSNQALSSSLSNGMTLTTLAGTSLSVRISGGTVTVGGATVVQPDVVATNGVIHIINSVLVAE